MLQKRDEKKKKMNWADLARGENRHAPNGSINCGKKPNEIEIFLNELGQ